MIKLIEDQPNWRTKLMEDQIDGGPYWWRIKLMKDQIDGGSNWWRIKLMEDQTDEGSNWWRIKLMEDQIDGGWNWWRTKLMEDKTHGGTKVMEDNSDFSVGTKQNQGLISICRLISRERLPGWILAVLPIFNKCLLPLSLCWMTLDSINNGILENRNMGNTASIQPGSLYWGCICPVISSTLYIYRQLFFYYHR